MNMKMYCYQCGQGMTYAGAPPNFCMNCGVKTNDAKAPLVDATETPIQTSPEEQEINFTTDINKLEIDIDIPANSILLAEVAGTQSPGQKVDEFLAAKRKKISKKKIFRRLSKRSGLS